MSNSLTVTKSYLQIMLIPNKMYVGSTTEPRYRERIMVICQRK